jgi:hypothetical protein
MENICVCCGEKEIRYIKRKLCQPCYIRLYHTGMLPNYPSVGRVFSMDNYDASFIGDLKKLVDDHHSTLQKVGDKHGLSRERIRQIFELFYGFKYTVVSKKNAAMRKAIKGDAILKKRHPREKVIRYKADSNIGKGAATEKIVYDICESLNYEIKPYDGAEIDIIINGLLVDVKSAHKASVTSPGQKTPSYHFQIRPSQLKADFIVCHIVPRNRFFIIPVVFCPKSRHLYISDSPERTHKLQGKKKSKYYEYLEAWHLLSPKKDIIFNEAQTVMQ